MNNTITAGENMKVQKKRVISLNHSNPNFSAARTRKNSGENIFALKRQIKDLREMVKEKDALLCAGEGKEASVGVLEGF